MAKKLTKCRNITVFCKCGEKLIKYRKWPWRRLLKIHRDRIKIDYNNIFVENYEDAWSDILCPKCNNRITTVQIVNWKYINKVNQGQIWIIKKS